MVHFYLAYKNGSDLLLACTSDKEIPQNLIPKTKKLYEVKTFKYENGKLWFEEKIKSYLKSHSEINVSENDLLPLKNLILKNCDKCGGFEIAEIPNFEKNLKEHAVGNFIKFKQFLHLHHLVKNLLTVLENLHTEESEQKRQDLYKKIFDFMSQNGIRWWD